MKIFIKQIQGDEIPLNVNPDTTVLDIRNVLAEKLKTKRSTLGLLLMGKRLTDDTTIASIPNMKEGTKIYLIIKKPESLQDAAFYYFKNDLGMDEEESRKDAYDMVNYVHQKLYEMSWDEVNMFCLSAMGKDVPERDILER